MSLLEALRRQMEHYRVLYCNAHNRLEEQLGITEAYVDKHHRMPEPAELMMGECYSDCLRAGLQIYRVRRLIDVELDGLVMDKETLRQLDKSDQAWRGPVQPEDLPGGIPPDMEDDGDTSCSA